MKLVIEYDPFGETKAAQSAQSAFQTLGMPVELRKLKFNDFQSGTVDVITPVKFDGVSPIEKAFKPV